MAAEGIRSTLEIIKWLDEVSAKPLSRDADLAEVRCQPKNEEDLRERLGSFRTWWWFNKPLALSPIECARRGWANTGPDALECQVCSRQTVLKVGEDGKWLVAGEATEVDEVGRALVSEHGPFCPWRSHCCPGQERRMDADLRADVLKRLHDLREHLANRPLLVDDFKDKEPLEVIARAGWAYAGHSDNGLLEHLRCDCCLRTVTVQSFDNAPTKSASEVEGEDEGAGEGEARPPSAGLWTPGPPAAKRRVVAIGDSRFDPYARHRFYCPFYNEEVDGLSKHARRVLDACRLLDETDAARLLPDDSDKNPIDAAEATLIRVDKLLRSLDDLLPPMQQ